MIYIYKVKKEKIKDLEQMGFGKCDIFYDNEKSETELLYAKPVQLDHNSNIVRSYINICNSPKWQKLAGVKYRNQRKKLAKENLDFEKVDKKWVLKETPELLRQISIARLCMETTGDYKNILFITDPNGFSYYNSVVLDSNVAEIIKILKDSGFIYRTKFNEKVEK